MANAYMRTSTEVSAIVPEVWSRRYYDVLLLSLAFNSLVSKDYEGDISAIGDKVRIASIPEFSAATEDVEGTATDADAVTVTSQTLTINKRVVKDFIVTNKAQLQSIPFVDKLREMAIFAIQKKIQANIIASSVPSAAAPDHQIAYGTALTLALADMLAAKELLDTQNVPMMDRHMVVGAGALNDIFNIVGFTSSDFLTSGQPLATGELPPSLLGFAPHFTTAVGTTSWFFHSSYFTMASQQGLTVKEFDMGVDGIRATRVNIDTLYGQLQLDNKRVVKID